MDTTHISELLGKIKKTLFKNEEVYQNISNIVSKHIGFPLEISSIKIKGTVIYVKESPLIKSEVFIHKDGILSDLKLIITDRVFTDIR